MKLSAFWPNTAESLALTATQISKLIYKSMSTNSNIPNLVYIGLSCMTQEDKQYKFKFGLIKFLCYLLFDLCLLFIKQ